MATAIDPVLPEDDTLNLDAFDPPEFFLARLNGQIREMMNAALRSHGLKLVEWRILQCLAEADAPYSVAELAELAVIDRTVASRLIEKMAAKGWITKTALKQDRRFVNVEISGTGDALYRTSLTAAEAARRRLFSGLSGQDVEVLLDTLARMQQNAESPRGLRRG